MSSLFRALQLRRLNRNEEAVGFFLEHLSQFPEDADGHAELSRTRLDMPGERRKALESIDRAISLRADHPHYHAVRSLILGQLDREPEAEQAADRAIALDPELVIGWLAKSMAASAVGQWRKAEDAARRVLEFDPDHAGGQNQLAMILRARGKVDEADLETGKRLERDPENPIAHANAGWAALQRREVQKAEEHFRESLRLDPGFEYARLGLVESYKARSGFYRFFLRGMFLMERFSRRQRLWILISVYFVFRFLFATLEQVHPVAVAAVVTLYLLLVFGSFLASGLSHFLLLRDRSARLALSGREKLEGLFVGGGFLLGFTLVMAGLTTGGLPLGVVLLGAALMVGAVPGAMFWTNDSRRGRLLFGAVSGYVYSCGFVCLVQDLRKGDALYPPAELLAVLGVLAAALCTWLSLIPALHRGGRE